MTIYLSNKWTSRIVAGDVSVLVALMEGGPAAVFAAPIISGAIGDHIPKMD